MKRMRVRKLMNLEWTHAYLNVAMDEFSSGVYWKDFANNPVKGKGLTQLAIQFCKNLQKCKTS